MAVLPMGVMLLQDVKVTPYNPQPEVPDWGTPHSPIVVFESARPAFERGEPIPINIHSWVLVMLCNGNTGDEGEITVRLGEAQPGAPTFTQTYTWPHNQSWYPVMVELKMLLYTDTIAPFILGVMLNGEPLMNLALPLIWERDFKKPPQPADR